MKKLLTLIAVLVSSFVSIFAIASFGNTREVVAASQPEKLYLTPNANWKIDNARFAAYFFGNGETWVSMTKVTGETDVYEVTVPTAKVYPNVIFCRMSPSATANNWNNKWNQTRDLVIPTNGTNLYTVKAGTWDKGGGTWSTFGSDAPVEPEEPADPVYYLCGEMTGWGQDDKFKFVPHTSENEVKLENIHLTAGTQFKVYEFITEELWHGYSVVNTQCRTMVSDAGGNEHNIKINATGVYSFYWNYVNKSLWIHNNSADTANELNTLIAKYYNEGVYTKVTDIYLNETSMNELATKYTNKGFHASVTELHRITYFNGGALWMSRADGKYSYYGTSGENMTNAVVGKVGEVSDKVAVAGQTMEEFYITMADVVAAASHVWTLENGVYTTKDATVMEWFKAITAPCYLGFDGVSENYITFTSASIQEVDGTLVLSLHASSNTGALTHTNGSTVFSQAVIALWDGTLAE